MVLCWVRGHDCRFDGLGNLERMASVKIGRRHVCDDCGKVFLSSCHECIHQSPLILAAINDVLGLLKLETEYEKTLHRRLTNLKEFNERRFIDLNNRG